MSLKDFQFIGKLGEGAYSSVYKVKRLIDNQIYAIKKVKMNNLTQRQKQNALNQVQILASINHPNIISYKQSFIDKSTNFLYIVMQLADNGDLYAKITSHIKNNSKFTEDQLWSIFIQVVRGLKALHQLRILHRDLKSANVFMCSDGKIKLGDMNVSKFAKNMAKTQTGTPYYASPQVWKDQPYDKKSDIWSLGCVFYQAIALKPPFRANDMEQLFKKVTRGFYPRIPPQYSDQLSNILKILLQVTPHLRPTCDKLLQLPVITKHLVSLPSSLQQLKDQKQKSPKNQLLKTIKISKDSKDNIQLQMPRARYISQLSSPPLIQRSQILPRISQQNQPISMPNRKFQSQIEHQKWNQKSQIVRKLTQPSTIRDISKSLHTNKYQHQSVQYEEHKYKKKESKTIDVQAKRQRKDEKLPLIYQGRLKSISPETLKKIIKRQKEKRKIYSILERKF